MRIPRFEYHAPKSLKGIITLLRSFGERATLIAGGTDLFVRMKQRLVTPEHLISIRGIKGLNTLSRHKTEGLFIGAGVTLATLVKDPIIRNTYPVLSYAASLVATTQIRNMATIGGNFLQNTRCMYYNRSFQWRRAVAPCFKRNGNICHAVEKSRKCFSVYQGDIAPVLIVLGGVVSIVSHDKAKEMKVEDLFTGDGVTPFNYNPPWILTGIRIPSSSERGFSAYRKYRLRDGMDFPLAGVAIAMEKEENLVKNLRICLTGVASSPLLIDTMDVIAKGKELTPESIREVAKRVYERAHPINNLEGEASRRRTMIRVMVEEMLRETIIGDRMERWKQERG